MSEPRKIRVLHVFGKMDRGGAETWVMHVYRALDRSKVQFDFAVASSDKGAYDDEIRNLGGRIFVLGSHGYNMLGYSRRFRQLLKEEGPYDILHSHLHHFSGVVLALGSSCSIPVRIAHSHNDLRGVQRGSGVLRRIYYSITEQAVDKFATAGFACSGAAAESLFGPAWCTNTKVRLLHYGIDLSPFRKTSDQGRLRRNLGIADEVLVVGHVGSFSSQKNHPFLLEIFAELLRLEPESRLLLVGDGSLRSEIEGRIQALGLRQHVHVLGSRPDVPDLMTAVMDVFVFPSFYEGLGLVLLEAQAAGLPCFYSDVVPPEADVVPELVNRISLEQGARYWAEKILSTRHRRIPLSKSLRHLEHSPFTITATVDSLTSLYWELVVPFSEPESDRIFVDERQESVL